MSDPVPSIVADPVELVVASRSSWLRGWVFRVGFVYWMMYCGLILLFGLHFPILDAPAKGVAWLFERFDIWFGHHVLGIAGAIDTGPSGSGDRTVNWIEFLDHLVISVVAATAWAAIDRRRARDAWLRELLHTTVRYALAFCLLSYGTSKVLVLQFPAPSDSQYLQRWGDSSPMNVLWTFMGSSPPYVVFTGVAEVLGAVLVWFRRTRTAGALVIAAVMVNVVMLNLCYDVPVKLFSSHLLAMCILLLLPELERLLDFFVLHRAIPAQVPAARRIAQRSWRITRLVVKYALVVVMIAGLADRQVKRLIRDDYSPWEAHWSTGLWKVTSFARNGQAVEGDDKLWSTLRFDPYGDKMLVRWRFADAEYGTLYDATFDEANHAIRLAVSSIEKPAQPSGPITLQYVHDAGDPIHLEVTAQVGSDALDVKLEHVDTSRMLLRARGFHWINEEPFNR